MGKLYCVEPPILKDIDESIASLWSIELKYSMGRGLLVHDSPSKRSQWKPDTCASQIIENDCNVFFLPAARYQRKRLHTLLSLQEKLKRRPASAEKNLGALQAFVHEASAWLSHFPVFERWRISISMTSSTEKEQSSIRHQREYSWWIMLVASERDNRIPEFWDSAASRQTAERNHWTVNPGTAWGRVIVYAQWQHNPGIVLKNFRRNYRWRPSRITTKKWCSERCSDRTKFIEFVKQLRLITKSCCSSGKRLVWAEANIKRNEIRKDINPSDGASGVRNINNK